MVRFSLVATLLCACSSQPAPVSTTPSTPPVTPSSPDSTSEPPASEPDKAVSDPAIAPVPFPPGSLAASIRAGAAMVFRVEEAGKAPYLQRMLFATVNAQGCAFENTILDLDGTAQGEPRTAQVSWDALERHAQFPRAHTTISEQSIEIPVGRFDTLVYQSRSEKDGRAVVTTRWFAKALPGPPVKMAMHVDGALAMSMVLIENHRP